MSLFGIDISVSTWPPFDPDRTGYILDDSALFGLPPRLVMHPWHFEALQVRLNGEPNWPADIDYPRDCAPEGT